MNNIFEGYFPVKLEFEDDSFELTNVQIFKSGKFSLFTQRGIDSRSFKMIFLSPEQKLIELLCKVEKNNGMQLVGKFSKIKRRK